MVIHILILYLILYFTSMVFLFFILMEYTMVGESDYISIINKTWNFYNVIPRWNLYLIFNGEETG
jgi:hypothetical protein